MNQTATNDPLLKKLSRRSVSVTLVLVLWALILSTSPIALALLPLMDLVTKARLSRTRFYLFICAFLSFEVGGLLRALFVKILRITRIVSQEEYATLNFRLQCWWASGIFETLLGLYQAELHVTGLDATQGDGPAIVLSRHVSSADSLIPTKFISAIQNRPLRFIMKRELLWDPCLDIVGHRLPNVFVDRKQRDDAITQISALTNGLTSSEGIVLFPEGTRFTTSRQKSIRESLNRKGDGEALQFAESLECTLPPRPAGFLALLDTVAHCDLILCAHSGLEVVHDISALISGELVGRRIAIHFWRIPADTIPEAVEQRTQWLNDTWKTMDSYVTQLTAGATIDAGQPPPRDS